MTENSATIKQHDFVELDYTGTVKDENIVFDTTIESEAKANNIHSENAEYKPIVICVGEKYVVPGLDKELIGKEVGKEYTIELPPEEAFGKKDTKFLQLVPTARFRKENITPFPGMQVNIDDAIGIVKTVSGGRTLVDFNHPLSGKNIVYRIKASRIVEDDAEKVKNVLKMQMGINDAHVHLKDGNAEVVFGQKFPEEIAGIIEKKVTELVPNVKKLSFVTSEEHKHTEHGAESHTHDKEGNGKAENKETEKEQNKKTEGKENKTAMK